MWTADCLAKVDPERVVTCFRRYLDNDGLSVSRADLEQNLAAKVVDETFTRDIEPLLARRSTWDGDEAATYLRDELLTRVPGEP